MSVKQQTKVGPAQPAGREVAPTGKRFFPAAYFGVSMEESPDTIHGRMKEGAHLAGYGLTRAMENLKWLLEDERYKQLSAGYRDVNEFLRDTKEAFRLLRIDPKERKQIAKLVKRLQPGASQRAIADMVGASDETIARDLGRRSPSATNVARRATVQEGPIDVDATNVAPSPWTSRYHYDPAAKALAEQRKKERERLRAERLEKTAPAPRFQADNYEIDKVYQGDASKLKLPENSIDFVLTDPPWSPDNLDAYATAFRISRRVLKPGHFMAIYCGIMALPKIIALSEKYLEYVWTYCVWQPDSNTRIRKWHLYNTWRPILLLRKPGEQSPEMPWRPDTLRGKRDKDHHDWGQSLRPARFGRRWIWWRPIVRQEGLFLICTRVVVRVCSPPPSWGAIIWDSI